MENMDTSIVTLGLLAIVGLLVLWSLLRRPKSDQDYQRTEISELKQTISDKDHDLREAWKNADRFEALAGERKQEIERLNGDLSKLRVKLDLESEQQRQLTATISGQASEMKAEKAASEEKIHMLLKIREDMEAKFKGLAAEALRVQGEQFSKSNLEKLHAALTPLKEHVGHFQTELKTVYKTTIEDRAALKAEIRHLSQRSEAISHEALALTRALKSDQQKQGAWGEMILESILERSGLREGLEYETQAHRTGDTGERLRPDVVVNIPGGKTLVIDSKVSLVAYTEAVNAETDGVSLAARKRHVASLRGHINGLSAKDYQKAENSSVDYVILFVPIEGALSEALREDGKLTEYALDKNVTIATPTTLMMALKTIAHVWAVERRNQNAEAIAKRAGHLYDKVVGFVDNMENVGKRLDQAQDAYQDAFGQLSRGRGNVLSQVETLKSLGAKTTKSLGANHEMSDDAHDQLERPDKM
jgi:DNA recombination protein RmuC